MSVRTIVLCLTQWMKIRWCAFTNFYKEVPLEQGLRLPALVGQKALTHSAQCAGIAGIYTGDAACSEALFSWLGTAPLLIMSPSSSANHLSPSLEVIIVC